MISKEQFMECERNRFYRMIKPISNKYKSAGLVLSIISFLSMIIGYHFVTDPLISVSLSAKVLLLSMLLMAVSREKDEDELLTLLRGHAFSFAFICGVLYAIIQPYINYYVLLAIKPEKAIYEDMSIYIVLWVMLAIHLATFHLLKKIR